MRVLIASQYYPPEITAASARLEAFAAGIAARGHEVQVVCEAPSHPGGVIEPGYRRPLTRRRLGGVGISHVWVYASPRKSASRRIANYASYAAMATMVGAMARRVDVVLATSPPLSVGAVGAALARRHRAPWVLDVRDLWPDIAVVMGELRGDRAIALAERLERRLYSSAAAIVTTTEPFSRRIEGRGGAGKVTVVANGTTGVWLEAGARDAERMVPGPQDRFTWMYAGNMGRAQGLEAAIDAAAILGDRFQLVLLGDGPVRGALRERAASLPNGSVVFLDAVPPERAASYMRAADALLVSLASWPALGEFVPSKLFDCAAVGRPVVLAAAGEASRMASAGSAALCVPPEDPAQIASAVRSLREDPGMAAGLAARGREFARRHDRSRGAEAVAELLEEAVAEHRARRPGFDV